MTRKSIFLTITILFSALFPLGAEQSSSSKFYIGYEAGWGAPFGWSLATAWAPRSDFDIHGGLGLNFSGFKAGLGGRYIYSITSDIGLHGGMALAYSSGSKIDFGIRDPDSQSIYRYGVDNIIHLRTGVRFVDDSMVVLLTIGWGFALKNDDALFVSGVNSYGSTAKLFKAGGFEASMSMLFSL